MANANRGLGRGLGALLGDAALQTESADSLYLPISQVESCASQPRKQFDPESLSDLADSIREHGIIQPLTVRKLQSGYYQIIAGERRWRAARMAGLSEVPAIVIEADDRKAMELALIENLQRADLNPIEEAEGYQQLISQYGMTQEQAAGGRITRNMLSLIENDLSAPSMKTLEYLAAGRQVSACVLWEKRL